MNKLKTIISALAALGLVGGLIAGVVLVQQRQSIVNKAAGATAMYIFPQQINIHPGDSFTFTVKVDTNGDRLDGFDIQMSFNPNAMEITNLQRGNQVQNFAVELYTPRYDNVSGTFAVGYATTNTNYAVNGSDITLVTVSGKYKAGTPAGDYNISFNPDTMAIGAGKEGTILVQLRPGILNIMRVGDITNDDYVNLSDVQIIIDYYNQPASAYPAADLVKDITNKINLSDLQVIIDNYDRPI